MDLSGSQIDTIQEICDKYQFEIYEYAKIRKHNHLFKNYECSFWADIDSILPKTIMGTMWNDLDGLKISTSLNIIRFGEMDNGWSNVYITEIDGKEKIN